MITIEEAQKLASEQLSEKRYRHTLAVAQLSAELAEAHGAEIPKAILAALLHDITKEKPVEWQLQRLENSGIIDETLLRGETSVFHSITAYLYASEELRITDKDLLSAIRYHTTGRADMSLLEKIVFTADTVAYDRVYEDAKRLRELSFTALDEVVLEICLFIITDITAKLKPICPDTIYCYNACVVNKPHRKG